MSGFLVRHWAAPLPAQGPAPPSFSPLEAALDPASCGTCHPVQLQDWRASLHARAMGPGILGQLLNTAPADHAGRQDCLRCHAPLAEQQQSLAAALTHPASTAAGSHPALHEEGLVCAACHVRGHRRFGPARRDGSAPHPDAALPHGGWTASTAFSDSRFCAACHQFGPDGYALNGKPLENTYAEWQSSRHAAEGRHCQSCHMPDRRHRWRGIHDADMVRQAVAFEPGPVRVEGAELLAELVVRNTGAGHFFPTYVTPRVTAEISQLDAGGRELPGTAVAHVIARQVPLDLSREVADTRLPPDGELRLDYRRRRAREARALRFRLRVEPDAYYADFYRDWLAAGPDEPMLRQALAQAQASPFVAFERRTPLEAAR